MKFRFLGTGTSSGVPMIGCDCYVCKSQDPRDKRFRTAAMLENGNTRIVFDTGPDFRQQILHSGIKELHAVVFTHSHKDHIAGMDDIRAFNFFMKKDMNIYGTSTTLDRVRLEFSYIFEAADYERKHGFGVPLSSWFDEALSERLKQIFHRGDSGYLKKAEVFRYIKLHKTTKKVMKIVFFVTQKVNCV